MFVRVKTSPNSPKKAVQIVESIRQGKRVKQRIVRHVGTALNDDELRQMRELAEYIKARMEQESSPGLFPPEELAEITIRARNEQKEDPLPGSPRQRVLSPLCSVHRVFVPVSARGRLKV